MILWFLELILVKVEIRFLALMWGKGVKHLKLKDLKRVVMGMLLHVT